MMQQTTESAAEADDYMRVADAIEFLRRERPRQPGLNELADHLGLSAAYTQRLFSRWAGISPKRFVQHLTARDIKRRLREGDDLLGAALDAGLSGPGRLHDLFVTLEGLSPGEYRRAAKDITVSFGMGATPFGEALVAYSGRGVCHLSFVDAAETDDAAAAIAKMRGNWPDARLVEDLAGSRAMLERMFAGDPAQAGRGLSLWVSGSNFQIQVWRALLRLPFGSIVSYGQLAMALGYPRAARAVGTAIGANPVGFLIPCHRVLRADGAIGDYHWGSARKAALIAWEAARSSGA